MFKFFGKELQRLNFFKGVVQADGGANIIIAIPRVRSDSNYDPFVLQRNEGRH